MAVNYQLTDDQMTGIDEIRTVTNLDSRIELLANLTMDVAEDNNIDDIEGLAREIGVREYVGTSMDTLSFNIVLEELAEFTEYDDRVNLLRDGGDADYLEEISANNRIDHQCYYALQTLYADAIYQRILEKNNTIPTSVVRFIENVSEDS